MDISKFSDPHFDVKEWVNSALRAHKDAKTPVDAHSSMLVMKLQLFIQEVNNALEETGTQVVQSLPRVLRDVEAVRQEALLLREQMLVVKEDIKKVESETSHSMQRLVDLDAIKMRMQESQIALQEADNWATLVDDVEDVFATQDIDQISEKVMRMQQSLNVLHDVPDYEERKKLLESLKNRVEALLSPRLTAAFNDHLTVEAQRYVEVFIGIEREQRVKDYYIQCHKNTIQQLWTSLQQSGTSLLNNLKKFYDELLTKWIVEHTWCSQVFDSPLGMLGKVFSESLNNLSPPLGQSLHSYVHRSSQPVQTLIELRSTMLRFLRNFSQSLQRDGEATSGIILYPLVEIFHLPYCRLLVQYGSLQQQTLMKTLSDISLSESSIDETLQSISQSLSTVMSSAGTALECCIQLTEGWGITALIKSLEAFFVQYSKKLSSVLKELRKESELSSEHEPESNKNGTRDDWTDLQWNFQFIQCCGDFLLRSSSLNSLICKQLISLSQSYRNPASSNNPFGVFDYLRIYHPEEHTAVMETLAAVEKNGDEYLLLPVTANQIKSLTENAHTLTFDILFAQLKRKLVGIAKLKVWERGVSSPLESPRAIIDDLPSFSRSPLSYITEIGDYLLTLPQQLEPFTSQDNPALMAAMKLSRLPFAETSSDEEYGHPSDVWISAIARGTMETYVESIMKIPRLTEEASQQLATDIGYLCNVLAALDQHPLPALTTLEKLLKSDKETFSRYEDDKNTDRSLYQSIAKVRTWT